MKFTLYRASNHHGSEEPPAAGAIRSGEDWWQIEFDSLEDLLSFARRVEESLIISVDKDGEASITIYDDYLE